MKLSPEDAQEIKGYLRAHHLPVEAAATMLDRHRTTLHKKLQGDVEMSPCDLIELGIRIAARDLPSNAGR